MSTCGYDLPAMPSAADLRQACRFAILENGRLQDTHTLDEREELRESGTWQHVGNGFLTYAFAPSSLADPPSGLCLDVHEPFLLEDFHGVRQHLEARFLFLRGPWGRRKTTAIIDFLQDLMGGKPRTVLVITYRRELSRRLWQLLRDAGAVASKSSFDGVRCCPCVCLLRLSLFVL